MNLKIYSCSLGYAGEVIVVASSEEAAKKVMEEKSLSYQYKLSKGKKLVIKVHEIVDGLFFDVENY